MIRCEHAEHIEGLVQLITPADLEGLEHDVARVTWRCTVCNLGGTTMARPEHVADLFPTIWEQREQ